MTAGPLHGKRVIITGAARGIGSVIAEACVAAGGDVIGLDIRPPDEPVAWSARIVDITDPSSVAALVDDIRGPVDCIVNNAGIAHGMPLTDLDDDSWRAVHNVNLAAPIKLIQQLLPILRTPGASIVNITSIRGSRGFPGDIAYTASKGGLDAATRALAVELGPAGIRVNAVAPGAITTDLNRELLADPGHRARVLNRIPLGRIGTPADVAGPVVFLASDAAQFVSGVTLPVDGAQTAFG